MAAPTEPYCTESSSPSSRPAVLCVRAEAVTESVGTGGRGRGGRDCRGRGLCDVGGVYGRVAPL